ncbi:putative arabinose efflux permease, MFS family [Lentzea aerocolonigenes]|nr:putative arabinose efflux permease, MFS family [Lentzea aerocolonigenes]
MFWSRIPSFAYMTQLYRRRWPALCALLLAEAMNLFDSTVMPIAAPAARADHPMSDTALQWLTNGYTLPFGLLLIAGGRLGDVFGRRRVFVIGMLVFVLCSVLCAWAPHVAVLLTARVVQGASAALIIPQTFGLIRAMFAEDEVARALGTIGPVMALSALCGPVAGGLLTDAAGWRSVFLVNVPLGLAVLAVAPLIREDRAPGRPRLGGLLRGRVFPASLAGSLLFFAVMNGLVFVLVLFLQLREGKTPTGAAVTLLPWSAGLALGSWIAGSVLVPRFGNRVMRLGLVLVLAGLAGIAVSFTAVPLLVAGFGLGVFTVPFFGNALSVAAPEETGWASGLLNAVQQLGATAGVALLGAVFFRFGTSAAVLASMVLIAGVLALTAVMVPERERAPSVGAGGS